MKARKGLKQSLPLLAVVAALALAITLMNIGPFSGIAAIATGALFFLIPIYIGIRGAFSSFTGSGKACKKAMAELAAKRGWKHEGAQHRNCMGSIRVKYRGRQIGIEPADEYAIEVELHERAFYLKTEPPGYPPESMRRFSTGNSGFHQVFPIRYAEPGIVRLMDSHGDGDPDVLAPLNWFLGRWGDRLGRMLVDWCSVQAHLAPGHMEFMGSGGRYLKPGDLEPFLEDMVTLAAAMDAVGAGRKPELPDA